MKWRKKELPSCSKLSMDDIGNLVNHSLTAPLRMVGKEWHNISSRGYWRPKVVLKVLRWSKRSFSPANGSNCGRWNFKGIEHSKTAAMKGESILLTIWSRLRSIFSLIALLSLSISLLISRRRSEPAFSGVASHPFFGCLCRRPSSSQNSCPLVATVASSSGSVW